MYNEVDDGMLHSGMLPNSPEEREIEKLETENARLRRAVQIAREVFNSRIDSEHCCSGPVDWENLKAAMDKALGK